MAEKKETDCTSVIYTKEQIKGSKRYADKADLVEALVPENGSTLDQVDKAISDYLKKEVN